MLVLSRGERTKNLLPGQGSSASAYIHGFHAEAARIVHFDELFYCVGHFSVLNQKQSYLSN
ncbi:TPA: hypothetical protein ACSTJZ_001358 [Serratia fonticola]